MTTEEQMLKDATEIAEIELNNPTNSSVADSVLNKQAEEIAKIESDNLAKEESEKPIEKEKEIVSEKIEGEGLVSEKVSTEEKSKEVATESVETPWYEKQTVTEVKAQESNVANSPENEAKLLDYENKIKSFEQIMEDPFIKAVLANKASGKGIEHLLEEIKPTDSKKLSAEQLIRYEADLHDLTDEESIQIEIDSLDSLSPLQKKIRLDNIRTKIEESNQARLKRYASETTTIVADREKSTQQAIQELKQKTTDLIDKDVFGLKITKEISSDIEDTFMNKRNPVYKSDGTPDIDASIKLYLWENQLSTLVKSNVIAAKFNGQNEVIKKITNPSTNTTTARVIDSLNELDELEQAEREYKNRQGIN